MKNMFIKNLWFWKCGLPEQEVDKPKVDIEDLKRSEWSTKFESLMRNRLVLGALRYGRLYAKNKPRYDRIGSIRKRISAYQITGNTEHLVDIANMCLLEFEEGVHPTKHFKALDDSEHTKIILGEVLNKTI